MEYIDNKKKAVIIALMMFFATNLSAAGGSGQTFKWGMLFMGLFGGLALFLYGMELMSEGMKKSAGNKMRSILSALTSNRVIGLVVGAFVTMVIQSSSATTVMLVSFVQAELMTFAQSLGVILGADIGTTITAQLVAFKLTDYALLMIAAGFTLQMFAKQEHMKHAGEAILGFGILFFGMKLMGDTMKPLRSHEGFIDLLRGMENPILGILVSAAFTAVVQSSSATTGIIIVLALQNLITLEAGIPLVMGANIGTCVTAGLASIGTTREAKRVAIAHVFFKIGGVLLFIMWIPTYADFVRWLGNHFVAGTARQIANAHTIFNVSLAFAFLPFTNLFANLIMKILPDTEEAQGVAPAIWHLDNKVIKTPSLAIDLARSEISRLSKILSRMLESVIIPFLPDSPKEDKFYPQLSLVEGIEMREEKIDFLDEKIVKYLMKIVQEELADDQAKEVFSLISITKDIESMGDIIHKNIVPLMSKKQALETEFSEEGQEELATFHLKVYKQIARLQEAFAELNPKKAARIIGKTEKYIDLESKFRIQHLERVREERSESMKTHEVHMELMDLLKQINVYAGNIANTIQVAAELRTTDDEV